MFKFDNYGNGIARGLMITLKHLARRPITVQYPEQKLNTSRRMRGQGLVWNKEKCTGCATCAKACPIGAIHITTSPDLVDDRYPVEEYMVDVGYCIQCGICVEACPFEAVYMLAEYERARYRRAELEESKEIMMYTPEKKVSGYFYPEFAEKLPTQTLLVDKITEEE